jgi:hypothetical protein
MKQDASSAAEQQHHHPGGLIETAPSFGSGFFSISTKGGSEFGGPTYFCSVPAEGQQQQQHDRPPTTLDPAKIDIGGRQLRQQQQQQDIKVSSRQQSPPLAPEQVTSITEKARTSTDCMESSIFALSDNMQCSGSFGMNDIDDDDDVNANNKDGNHNIIKIVGIDPSTIGVLNNKNYKENNSSPQSVMSLSNAGAGVEMETNSRGGAALMLSP